MEPRLKKKIALITGAGSGIGKAIAKRFVLEGASVAINDLNEENLQKTASEVREMGGNCITFTGDVSDSATVQKMADFFLEKYPRIDILVNSAGIGTNLKPILRIKEDEWDRILKINLTSIFLMCKYFGKRMKKNRGEENQIRGKIINISSMRGKMGRANYGAYSASKFGVIGLTQSLALELGKSNITVNVICPGLIHTPIYGNTSYDALASMNKEFPVALKKKPVGLAEDVAGTAFHIASSDADWITGQSFAVSGGQNFF
ncbi:MAG: SDR family NAD(P)-dependent oxidoreductase [Promethearchaeota archaeon]